MNLVDIEKSEEFSYFTPDMLKRLQDNIANPTYHPRYLYYTGDTAIRTQMEALGLDVDREIRQIYDYWADATRVTNLDLPTRIDGVFLDPERR
jgi:hypothetical protein